MEIGGWENVVGGDWCGVFGGVWDGGCEVSWHRGFYREGFVDGDFLLRLSYGDNTDRYLDRQMAVDMGYLMCTVLRTVRYECADVARRACCGVWYVVPNGYCEVQLGVLSLFSRFRSLCLFFTASL